MFPNSYASPAKCSQDPAKADGAALVVSEECPNHLEWLHTQGIHPDESIPTLVFHWSIERFSRDGGEFTNRLRTQACWTCTIRSKAGCPFAGTIFPELERQPAFQFPSDDQRSDSFVVESDDGRADSDSYEGSAIDSDSSMSVRQVPRRSLRNLQRGAQTSSKNKQASSRTPIRPLRSVNQAGSSSRHPKESDIDSDYPSVIIPNTVPNPSVKLSASSGATSAQKAHSNPVDILDKPLSRKRKAEAAEDALKLGDSSSRASTVTTADKAKLLFFMRRNPDLLDTMDEYKRLSTGSVTSVRTATEGISSKSTQPIGRDGRKKTVAASSNRFDQLRQVFPVDLKDYLWTTFKEMIVRMEEDVSKRQHAHFGHLEKENELLTRERDVSRRELSVAKGELEVNQTQLAQSREEYENLKAKYEEREYEHERMSDELLAAKEDHARIEKSIGTLTEEYVEMSDELQAYKTRYGELRVEE